MYSDHLCLVQLRLIRRRFYPALGELAAEGRAGLSLRALAASLGLAPNALYRYFSDRAELESALADASAGRLHQMLQRAIGKKQSDQAIVSMARAYLKFQREQPRVYETMMQPGSASGETFHCHQELWAFVLERVTQVADSGRCAASRYSVVEPYFTGWPG